jgi:antitoxin (DNA-binding transcriptional repressor) of toxin-antitoxin stability system
VRAVELKVLRNKLSKYIRLAAGGETILVTDRDHVVAEISPPGATRAQDLPDVLLAEAAERASPCDNRISSGTGSGRHAGHLSRQDVKGGAQAAHSNLSPLEDGKFRSYRHDL